MKISFEERRESVIFRIENFDGKYEPVMAGCFYQRDWASYFKQFLKSTKDLATIQLNYACYAEEMFNQMGLFNPAPWENGLEEFIKRVGGTKIEWWLTGSCASCIRGIQLNPHDIDIMIDSRDVDAVHSLFIDRIFEPILDTNGWVTKDFGVIFLHARIDIASDPQSSLDHPETVDCGPYAKEHLEEVIWRGFPVKLPPIQLQINVNKRRKRDDRVKILQEFLAKNGCVS